MTTPKRSVSAFRPLSPLACLLLTAAGAIGAETPASPAKSPAPADEEIVQLSEFTVSDRSADRYRSADAVSAVRVRAPLIDTPSSLTVLTREFIDDLAPTRIFDVTRFVAGVQEGRGIQFQDRMIIRGFETQNGARTVDSFLQSADADNIEESVIDRIEVAKGPNAILSPAGAPGGSVNVVTKSPLFQAKRSLTLTAGLFDAQKATLDMTGPLPGDHMAYRLVGSYQDSRRYWSSDSRLRGKALAPMFSWRISDKTMLTVKAVGAEHWIYREPLLILDPAVTASTDDPYLAPGFGRHSRNGIAPWSHVGTHSGDLFAVLTSSFNEHISIRVAANGRYYYEDSDQAFLSTPSLNNRYNPSTGELTQDYTWAKDPVSGNYVPTYSRFFDPHAIPVRGQKQWTTRRTFNFQSDLAANYRFGAVSSQTVAGVAYSWQQADGRVKDPGVLPAIDLRDPSAAPYPAYPTNLTQRNGSSYKNLQFYVNQRFGFLEDRLYLTGGLLRYTTVTKAWNALTNSAPSVLDDGKLMWTASVLGKLRDNVSLYYSRSNNSSPVIANNLPLWRSGVQDEAGVKSEYFKKRLSVTAAWFQISQTNVTVPNPARQTDPTAPEQLVSDLGNHGLELEAMGSITDNLSLVGTYSKLKMRDALGRHVRGVADDLASLLLNYRFADGDLKGLSLTFGVNRSGRRAGDVPINYTPLNVVGQTSFFLKPHNVTTFSAAYRFSEKLSVRLNVDNVFDQKGYISVAGGRVSGTGITTQPGMNLRLSTTFSF